MKLHSSSKVAVCLIGALVLTPFSVLAQGTPTYSGQATALKATALGISITLADTGPLPSTGGSITRDLPSVNVGGLLTASALHSQTSGSGNSSQSNTHLASLSINGLVRATGISTSTTATCNGSTASTSGDAQFVTLAVAGQQIVNANPNLAISLPGGIAVIVNEQTSSGNGGNTAQTTVTALHITGPSLDVVVGSSHSDIACP